MLRRVIKNKKKFTLRNSKGYTLVELIVVMGIVGLLLAITFGGYVTTRKEKYVQHVASLTQTNIRDTFIDTLSTKVENGGGCNNQAAQVKAVRINLGEVSRAQQYPVSKVSFCLDSTGSSLGSPSTELIDSSSGLNYSQKLDLYFRRENNVKSNVGYLYFIFTSPYGKYYSYYDNTTSLDASTADATLQNILNTSWIRENMIYKPVTDPSLGEITVYFDSDISVASGIIHTIKISENGNVRLD